MYGPQDATLLILSSARLDQRVINALESAGKALGHADGVCIATLAEAGEDIAAFIMFGDVPLTRACAKELLKIAPSYDYLITAEERKLLKVLETDL